MLCFHRFIELVLVVDNRIFIQFGRNLTATNTMSKQIVMRMNSLFSPLNIYIALVGVVIWHNHDQVCTECCMLIN